MVRSGYPFRDSNRSRPDDTAGNRRDDMAGNRREESIGNRRDEGPGNRRDREQQRPERRPRAENTPPSALGSLTGDIEELLRLLAGSDVTELLVERGDLKVTI